MMSPATIGVPGIVAPATDAFGPTRLNEYDIAVAAWAVGDTCTIAIPNITVRRRVAVIDIPTDFFFMNEYWPASDIRWTGVLCPKSTTKRWSNYTETLPYVGRLFAEQTKDRA